VKLLGIRSLAPSSYVPYFDSSGLSELRDIAPTNVTVQKQGIPGGENSTCASWPARAHVVSVARVVG
jgi:hypothetical protein